MTVDPGARDIEGDIEGEIGRPGLCMVTVQENGYI